MQTLKPVTQTALANPAPLDRTAALAALAVMEVAVNQLREALGFPLRPLAYFPDEDRLSD
jgi:hypothetical protein